MLSPTTALSRRASPGLSPDAAGSDRSSAGVPEKPGYPDSVYVRAANIFQGIRTEKAPDKVLIKYGNQPLPSSESEDESWRRLSYELAFSALKFTKAQAVVYCTCSVYPEENEAVVKKALDFQDPGIKRDPSETVSVKDVLARAAAKGLLDGIELGKSAKKEKKKKKSKMLLPKASMTENGVQLKIAEFLSRETKANANRSEMVATKTPLPQKGAAQVGVPSQIRKPGKPAPNPLVATSVRNTGPCRPCERHTNFGRPRPEDRMVALKPVEIVLPPVFLPFPSSPGIKSQIPSQHLFFRTGPKPLVSTCLPTPSVCRRGEKPKENVPSSLNRRLRPWL
ncbi:Putative methyltransferase NSUN7 [Tupaia chinensis]|uniref:Putative methyltransferase NSUN7 n=1 Tax=Tupaia chinensis TaxID=246437 RepID=L8Y5V1_TUPCH|nr:Putative methyltransferase NSUN7 [Tupaia chinensis]